MKLKHLLFNVFLFFSVSITAQEVRILTDTTSTPDIEIDEITVKSPKEYPQVREVPASISVIPSRKLEYNQVNTLADISSGVPNFFMLDYGSKLQSSVFIRGIGSKLGSPSVGLYVDHVPYFEKTTFGFDFYDLERIEILRGPQGTLYGRNTMGGIVNIFTKSPLYYQGTKISATAGNYGYYNANINHYQKLSDKVGFSISGNILQHDGYFTNDFLEAPADDKISVGGRGRLSWNITDKFTLENIASYEYSKQNGFPYADYNPRTGKTGTINYNQESYYRRDLFSDGLILKYRDDNMELISTTSYQYYDGTMGVDMDYTKNSLFYFTMNDKQNMVSQEVMAKSLKENNYKWLFGVYGFYQSLKQPTIGDLFMMKMKQDIHNDYDISGFALFHQSTIDNFIFENLSLTAGIRLDFEKDVLDYKFSQSMGGAPLINFVDTTYDETFTQILPKFALRYKVSNSASIYGAVSKGYKSGGFNTTTSNLSEDNRYYDPESSWNYEIGTKTSFINNRLQINAALFYIDWNKQQLDLPVPNGQGIMKANAGESVSKGGELFVKALPGRNIELSFGYGYTHATFDKYIISKEINYNGNFIPCIPRHTINIGANKIVDFDNTFIDKLIANINYKGVGKHYWDVSNSAMQDYYGLLNAKLSFEKGLVQLDIWGKNLLNVDYNSYYFEVANIHKSYVQLGKPVTFGANIVVRF